ACNFRCSFCPLVSLERPLLTMPREMVLDLIGQISRDALAESISFHVMGEPTLHKHLVEFCRVATESGLDVSLVTNGSRLSPAMSAALLDTGLRKISVSLRSPNDEYYSEIFKASKTLDYESYLKQVRSLISDSCARGPDHPTAVVVRLFVDRFRDKLREKVPHQGALYSTEAVMARLRAWGEEFSGMSAEALREAYPDRFRGSDRIPLTPGASILTGQIMRWWQQEADQVETKYPARISYCGGYNEQFAVLADGRVTACCLDAEGRTSLGNVKDLPLKEILGATPVSDFVGSFKSLRPPTRTCAKCLGGNTLVESIGRQALNVYRRVVNPGQA
ncbi:MAG: radical SAM protein, partial [Deltaproteobacteria bacterium]|nr:radical SAM protein [Deltaproteobacteria bacterium]